MGLLGASYEKRVFCMEQIFIVGSYCSESLAWVFTATINSTNSPWGICFGERDSEQVLGIAKLAWPCQKPQWWLLRVRQSKPFTLQSSSPTCLLLREPAGYLTGQGAASEQQPPGADKTDKLGGRFITAFLACLCSQQCHASLSRGPRRFLFPTSNSQPRHKSRKTHFRMTAGVFFRLSAPLWRLIWESDVKHRGRKDSSNPWDLHVKI